MYWGTEDQNMDKCLIEDPVIVETIQAISKDVTHLYFGHELVKGVSFNTSTTLQIGLSTGKSAFVNSLI